MQKLNTLTPNGNDLLERLSRGETVAQVAVAWGVTPTIVYRALRRSRAALGARTDLEAMARWARNGRNGAT